MPFPDPTAGTFGRTAPGAGALMGGASNWFSDPAKVLGNTPNIPQWAEQAGPANGAASGAMSSGGASAPNVGDVMNWMDPHYRYAAQQQANFNRNNNILAGQDQMNQYTQMQNYNMDPRVGVQGGSFSGREPGAQSVSNMYGQGMANSYNLKNNLGSLGSVLSQVFSAMNAGMGGAGGMSGQLPQGFSVNGGGAGQNTGLPVAATPMPGVAAGTQPGSQSPVTPPTSSSLSGGNQWVWNGSQWVNPNGTAG